MPLLPGPARHSLGQLHTTPLRLWAVPLSCSCPGSSLQGCRTRMRRVPPLQQARSRRSVAGKDIMLDPRAGIRKAGAMPPLMALLREVVEVRSTVFLNPGSPQPNIS